MYNRKLKTMKTIKLLAILFISALAFTACEDDNHDDDHDHEHEHEEEITKVEYTLTNTDDSTDVVTFIFTDEDGEGGADGTTEISGELKANATYAGVLKLINIEENEDVSAEIAANEAEEHEIFYTSKIQGVTFETTDFDKNSNSLGFNTNVVTGDESIGDLTITVVHEGKKPNEGLDDALSEAGTTDIVVTFKNIEVHDEEHEHEEEITKVEYTLTNTTDASDVVTLTFTDEDGEGGADGVFNVSGALTANASYTGVLKLINIEESEDISAEIIENEAEEHEVFFISNVAGLTISKTDADSNSNPIGFETNIITADAGTGALTIAVIHEGKKPNDGTVADALSGAGTTDIELTFTVSVE
jgi:azurin